MGGNAKTSINGEIALTLPAFSTDIEKQVSMSHGRRHEKTHRWAEFAKKCQEV